MINSFEDLEVWRESRQLTNEIYRLTGNGRFAKDFGLAGQIQRASVSVMSNIAEGFARGGNKEFKQFLFISRGSLAEVNSQLYIAADLNYISQEDFKNLDSKVKTLSKRIMSLINKIDTSYKPKQSKGVDSNAKP